MQKKPVMSTVCPSPPIIFCLIEHPAVYTLGKKRQQGKCIANEDELRDREIQFFHTNREGTLLSLGAGQIVGYPILDLERFKTDIGKYLRKYRRRIILTPADYGIKSEVRSAGETGVWIDAKIPGHWKKRYVRLVCGCSRWVTTTVCTECKYWSYLFQSYYPPAVLLTNRSHPLEKELGQNEYGW